MTMVLEVRFLPPISPFSRFLRWQLHPPRHAGQLDAGTRPGFRGTILRTCLLIEPWHRGTRWKSFSEKGTDGVKSHRPSHLRLINGATKFLKFAWSLLLLCNCWDRARARRCLMVSHALLHVRGDEHPAHLANKNCCRYYRGPAHLPLPEWQKIINQKLRAVKHGQLEG